MVLRAIYHALRGLAERSAVKRKGFARLQSLGKLGIAKPHVWKGRNSILDIDLNMHMNNASYVYLTELARWRFSGLNGLLGLALSNKWQFIVGSQAFRYRRAIPPFAKFEIHTQIGAMDDRWIYLSHTFVQPSRKDGQEPKVYAEATVRALVMHMNGEKIAPAKLLEALGVPAATAELLKGPENVQRFQAFLSWDKATDASMKAFGQTLAQKTL